MRCSNCGICCTETEMLLSKKDIVRLEKRGLKSGEFTNVDEQGYSVLKNKEGYCVFYDRKNHRCSVYTDRPEGCRVYPVILDEDVGIVLDEICECRGAVRAQEKQLKGKKVVKLLEIIDFEAAERRSSQI
jgi:Fe-S-cluster containining protein